MTFSRYVERFRHGRPQSREERRQMFSAIGEEGQEPFWWVSDSSLPASSTPTKTTDKGLFSLIAVFLCIDIWLQPAPEFTKNHSVQPLSLNPCHPASERRPRSSYLQSSPTASTWQIPFPMQRIPQCECICEFTWIKPQHNPVLVLSFPTNRNKFIYWKVKRFIFVYAVIQDYNTMCPRFSQVCLNAWQPACTQEKHFIPTWRAYKYLHIDTTSVLSETSVFIKCLGRHHRPIIIGHAADAKHSPESQHEVRHPQLQTSVREFQGGVVWFGSHYAPAKMPGQSKVCSIMKLWWRVTWIRQPGLYHPKNIMSVLWEENILF